jgi:hypothetical protein
MSETLNWHDAHALMLIDHALDQGSFTAELVAQISEAFACARRAERRIESGSTPPRG